LEGGGNSTYQCTGNTWHSRFRPSTPAALGYGKTGHLPCTELENYLKKRRRNFSETVMVKGRRMSLFRETKLLTEGKSGYW